MGIIEFAIRLATAILLGLAIGIERQWRQRNAGLRTNTLVALGAAAFVLLSVEIGGDATGRIASYIVSGIGFLGAGVIMKDGLNVQGLNTAATIWCSAAVGSLCGLGCFAQAGLVTLSIMLTHIVLRPIGQKITSQAFNRTEVTQTDYIFRVGCKTEVENHIRLRLMQMLGNEEKLLLKSLGSDGDDDKAFAVITAVINTTSRQDSLMERVASLLTIEDKVVKVSWQIIGTQSESEL